MFAGIERVICRVVHQIFSQAVIAHQEQSIAHNQRCVVNDCERITDTTIVKGIVFNVDRKPHFRSVAKAMGRGHFFKRKRAVAISIDRRAGRWAKRCPIAQMFV